VTVLHPVVSFGIVLGISVLALVVGPNSHSSTRFTKFIRTPVYEVLPSTELLSEDRFLAITHASRKQAGWRDHTITLAYGLDYAFVCLLLAMLSFHYRNLKRD